MVNREQVVEMLATINYTVTSTQEREIIDHRGSGTGFQLTEERIERTGTLRRDAMCISLQDIQIKKIGKGCVCLYISDQNFLNFYNHDDYV